MQWGHCCAICRSTEPEDRVRIFASDASEGSSVNGSAIVPQARGRSKSKESVLSNGETKGNIGIGLGIDASTLASRNVSKEMIPAKAEEAGAQGADGRRNSSSKESIGVGGRRGGVVVASDQTLGAYHASSVVADSPQGMPRVKSLEDELMPYKTQKRIRASSVPDQKAGMEGLQAASVSEPGSPPPDGIMKKRASVLLMQDFMSSGGKPPAGALPPPGPSTVIGCTPVTKKNIKQSLAVVRGPAWKYDEEDGGCGRAGTIFGFDKKAGTVTVYWQFTGAIRDHYRYQQCSDLAIAPEAVSAAMPQTFQQMNNEAAAEQSTRRNSKPGGAASTVAAAFAAVKSVRRLSVIGPSTRVVEPLPSAIPIDFKRCRRNSQDCFDQKTQTVIIFDWDDTLFPTTYVRDDLELSWKTKMANQNIDKQLKKEITNNLDACAKNVVELCRLADSFGKVVLVTLARSPWVTESCNNFFATIGPLLRELNVPIVYAQEGNQIEYDKRKMKSNEDIEQYWSKVKGKAIAKEVKSFYSQYEGQSWKNIISIGDSDFERLGTQAATDEYMKLNGLVDAAGASLGGDGCAAVEADVDGHLFKVRTKTFKMLDQPTIEELTIQVEMLTKWLPLMVALDDGFDVNLNNIDDTKVLQDIETTLRGKGVI